MSRWCQESLQIYFIDLFDSHVDDDDYVDEHDVVVVVVDDDDDASPVVISGSGKT